MRDSPQTSDGDPAVLDELVFRYLEDLEETDSDPERLLDDLCAEEPGYDSAFCDAIRHGTGRDPRLVLKIMNPWSAVEATS